MYNKHNQTWSKESSYIDTEEFIEVLEKLKTYSKSLNASGYSITNTLDDVYQSQGFKSENNSVNNLFTSEKVISKMLKNFHLVSLASTENVDITKAHKIKLIDGVKIGNGQRVLLKDQNNPVENGLYVYLNKMFKLDKAFTTVNDYYLFYAYVKEGNTNAEKHFVLQRDEDGYFPELESEKVFIEGTNYIIRNRISYKLLRNHQLNDASYFTEAHPVDLNIDFTDKVMLGTDYFVVSDNKTSLLYISGDSIIEIKTDGYKLLNRIEYVNSTLYVVGFNGISYDLLKLSGEEFTVEKSFTQPVVDFQVLTTIPLVVEVLHENTLGRHELRVINGINFYLTPNTIETETSTVMNVKNPSKLRFDSNNDITSLYYLENQYPKKVSITTTTLNNMLSMVNSSGYEKVEYSKTKIGDWEVKDGELFLKGFKITNLTDVEYTTDVPKISNSNTYDGSDAYSILSTTPIKNAISVSDRLTIQTTISPADIKVNMPVFYLGAMSVNVDNIDIQNNGYITLLLSDTDGFPSLVIASPTKLIKVRANKKIIIGEELNISFTYYYTKSRAVTKLYFNGLLVGSYSDQANTLTKNEPINLRDINFDVFYLGKSELNYPVFQGKISETRLWDIDLNPAQIITRQDLTITSKDIYYNNLKGYWKLNDIKGQHKEEILNETIDTNYFIGGLNRDVLLKEITNVTEIQKSDSSLYVLGRHLGNSTIFKIDIIDEKITIERNFADINLKSIHYNQVTDKLYYLYGNSIYLDDDMLFDNGGSIYDITTFTTISYLDKTHILFSKTDNKIYDTTAIVYDTPIPSIDKIYGVIDNGLSINLYVDYVVNDKIETRLLSSEYSSLYGLFLALSHIVDYPFISKEHTGIFNIENNVVYENDKPLDAKSGWATNAKTISSIYTYSNVLYVLVVTYSNDINLWSYSNGKYTRLADTNNHYSLAKSNGSVDFTFINEFLIISNVNEVLWYKVTKTNKLLPLKWIYSLSSDIEISNVYNVANKLWLSNDTHIFNIQSISNEYGVWEDSMSYNYKNNGLIVGNNGIIFKDDMLSSTWSVSIQRCTYRNNFNAIQSYIETLNHTNGYKVDTWSGQHWIVGDAGIIITTKDNGLTWETIESSVNHNLKSVSFIDNKIGIIAGENGTLLATFSGNQFDKINLPSNISTHSWNKVLVYHTHKAIVLGNGIIIHLSRVDNNWEVDNISNPNVDTIANYIQIRIYERNESDTYNHSLNDIVYLSNNEFIVVGERGMLCYIKLNETVNFITPVISIQQTNTLMNWKQVTRYNDLVENNKSLLLTSQLGIYKLTSEKWYENEYTSLEKVTTDSNIESIAYCGGSEFIAFGKRALINRYGLYTDNGSMYIPSNQVATQKSNVSNILSPKLLFLDYYLGRKINLHLNANEYEIPSGNVVLPSEYSYIAFTAFGRTTKDNNFLTYQDFYFMNRRRLNSGFSFGKMENEWLSYNKTFTKTTTPTKYIKTITVSSNTIGNIIFKSSETIRATKLIFANATTFAKKGDVLKLDFINNNTSVFNETVIVRDSFQNTISLYDLLSDEMLNDFKGATLTVTNLNYYDGTLNDLERKFKEHLLGQSYKLSIVNDGLFVEGLVNDITKYYNLETNVEVYTSSGKTTHPVLYSEDVVYGTQYNLLSFLNNINNNLFTSTYNFNLPSGSFNYRNVVNLGGEFKEFTVTGNKIFVGTDIDISAFRAGLYYDIEADGNKLLRVYLSRIEVSNYEDYPDKVRYILHFDQELEVYLYINSGGSIVTITGRGKLGQISEDLEFTDNIMFPLTNNNDLIHLNKSYFNQTKTAFAYSKFFIENVDIQKNVSALVYVDESSDWNINIMDWQSDSNLTYLPADLHTLGIDNTFRKAISITPNNLSITDNKLRLINVDMEKYNFKLVDGLTLKDIEDKYHWILNADIKNAVIGENNNGLVWYEGTWIGGTWEDGTWYSGKAYNMEWLKGNVYAYNVINNNNIYEPHNSTNQDNTVWYSGVWYSGTWHNGMFINGLWHSGVHIKGTFIGTWNNGVWNNGIFQGVWHNGTWYNGMFSEYSATSIWYNGTWLGGDFENGIWKNGIWDETVRTPSRFGTKASLLHNAIWEYGYWKNGQFHSGLTLNGKGDAIGSKFIRNAIWYNGTWDNGTFYGGIWKYGIWNNGLWFNGLWQSNLDINITNNTTVTSKNNHYYKNLPGLDNYLSIVDGSIIRKHKITDIVDDKTFIISNDISYTTVKPSSYWEDGTWFGGIWEYGYRNNGFWKGGIWLDGIHNNGEFGE